MTREVVVIIGAGGIGMAIARRQGLGKTVLLADNNPETLSTATRLLEEASFTVVAQLVDVTSRTSVTALAEKAAALGAVMQLVNTAGLSPNMAPVEHLLAVDLYGPAMVFEEFEKVIAPGGAGLIIASMAGHMMPELPAEQNHALAYTPADDLLGLPFLGPDTVSDSMLGYIYAKRANALRVQGAAVAWGNRGARINSISPGIVATPLAQHELASPIGDGYRAMIAASAAGRMAPPDEIAAAAEFLLSAGFITGSDLLIDGGVIAAQKAGLLNPPTE